jgi:hypothetical protein
MCKIPCTSANINRHLLMQAIFASCSRYGLNIVHIVWVDGSLNMVKVRALVNA